MKALEHAFCLLLCAYCSVLIIFQSKDFPKVTTYIRRGEVMAAINNGAADGIACNCIDVEGVRMPELCNIAFEHIGICLKAFKSVQVMNELRYFLIYSTNICSAFKSCNLNTCLFRIKGKTFLKGGHRLSLHEKTQPLIIEHLLKCSILLCFDLTCCRVPVNKHLRRTNKNRHHFRYFAIQFFRIAMKSIRVSDSIRFA